VAKGKKRKTPADGALVNRKARFNYFIEDSFEAGIVLTGTEVKSLREKRVQFGDSFASVDHGELLLYNLHISPYAKGNYDNHEPERTRKLLVHKKEIKRLFAAIREKRKTLVPLKIYLKGGRFKFEIGVCTGKKQYDKRETIKKRDLDRENPIKR
jgi:SsrA-binding protein